MSIGSIRNRIATSSKTAHAAPRPHIRGDGDTSWMHSGKDLQTEIEKEAQRRARLDEERAKRYNAPWRFWLGKGEQADVIILDEDITCQIYEHEKFKQGSQAIHETCPGDWESCPLCEEEELGGFKGRTFVAFLSVIDMRPYTSKDGKTHRPYTKKLLPIKFDSLPAFLRLKERIGSLRGAHVLMVRDQGARTAAIGIPEFQVKYPEEEIIKEFSHPEVKNEKGIVVKQANEDCHPYNYGVVFPKPSGQHLRDLYGGTAPAGSSEDNKRDSDTDAGWGKNDPGQVAQDQEAAAAQQGMGSDTSAVPPVRQRTPPSQAQQPASGISGIRARAAAPQSNEEIDDEIPF